MKKIVKAEESRVIALEAIREVAGIVKQTLGPGGNPIVIQQFGQNPDGTPRYPLITKDGVSVAESVVFRDPTKNTFAQAMLQVAKNTVNQAGDGTTTAIVLAEAMYLAGYKHLQQGENGIQLYNKLKEVKNLVFKYLDEMTTPIKAEDLITVARISANGDEDIAQKVSEALQAVGENGHVDLQEGFSRETTLDIIDGAMYQQGWRKFGPLGSLMVNDKVRNICELENPAVLTYAGELRDVVEVSDFLKKFLGVAEDGGFDSMVPLVFIAYDFSEEVKNYIIQLRVQGKMPIAAIKAPFDGSPNARTQMLEDLAVLLGGQVAARGIIDLKSVTDEHLGCADKIEIGAEETVFFNGQGDKESIMQRVNDLRKQLDLAMHDYDKENIRLRIGKLVGGIGVIKVGGDSELEMKERRDRIEDALCAAKVAIQEGIVPGGGLSLYAISTALTEGSLAESIMKKALQAPIRQIITNVGENADVVLSHMPLGQGYDANKKEYQDLMKAGIVDPVKVTKSALENAVSIVGLLLTTGGAIVSDLESADGKPNPLAAMMGM